MEEDSILTGRAREAFADYFNWNYEYDKSKYSNLNPGTDLLDGFLQMPLSMQIGVFFDWLDHEGLEVLITLNQNMQFTYTINGKHCPVDEGFPDRMEARTAALEHAIEVFNRTEEIKKKRNEKS